MQGTSPEISPLENGIRNYLFFLENSTWSSQRHLKGQTCRTKIFSYCIKIWNGFDSDMQGIDQYRVKITPFIEIKSNSVFSVNNVYGAKRRSKT